MNNTINRGSRRGAGGDHVADPSGHRLARTDLKVAKGGTLAEPPPAPLEIRPVDHPLGVVVTLAGELDLANASLLQKELDGITRGGGAVVIDLSGLRFIDSSGLHVLLRAERQLRAAGGQLVLVHAPSAVRRVFELTGLDQHFAWRDSKNAALRTVLEGHGSGPHGSASPPPARKTAPQPESEHRGEWWS